MRIPVMKGRRRRGVALSGQDATLVDRLARRRYEEKDEPPSGDVTIIAASRRRLRSASRHGSS